MPKQLSRETKAKISTSLRSTHAQRRADAAALANPTYARAKVLHDHFVSAAPDSSAAEVKVRNHGDIGRDVRPVELGRSPRDMTKPIEQLAQENNVKRGRERGAETEGTRMAPRPVALHQTGVAAQRSTLTQDRAKLVEKARGSV